MKRILTILLLAVVSLNLRAGTDKTVSCRAESIAVAGDRVYAAWTSFSDKGVPQPSLVYSTDAGQSWTAFPVPVRKLRDLRVVPAPDGALHVFGRDAKGLVTAYRCADPSAAKPLWSEGTIVCSAEGCGKPVAMSGGIFILPVNVSYGVCALCISLDGGQTWKMSSGRLKVPEKVASCNWPALYAGKNGELFLVVKSAGKAAAYVAMTSDMGQSWMTPKEIYPNPDTRTEVVRMPDNRMLMVKASSINRKDYSITKGLYVYISTDKGKTWNEVACIDSRRDVCMPSLCVDGNDAYVLYSYDVPCQSDVMLSKVAVPALKTEFKGSASPAVTVASAPLAARSYRDRIAALDNPKKKWADTSLKVATYNIQYPAKVPAWSDRLPALVKLIRQYDFDLFGSQEPFLPQIEDLMKHIGDEYAWVGDCTTGDNTYRKAHFNPIFYRKSRLELLDHGLIWFSEVPTTPGYGAMYARNCVWAKFRDKKTGMVFFDFNCHFDHKGIEARNMSARIIVEKVLEMAGKYPCMINGDFNAKQDSYAYKYIADCGFIKDALYAVENPVNAEYYSMSHYKPMDTVPKHGMHLDHLFFTPYNSRVTSWHMITDSYDGQFGSDHFPIMMEWWLAN